MAVEFGTTEHWQFGSEMKNIKSGDLPSNGKYEQTKLKSVENLSYVQPSFECEHFTVATYHR